VGFGSPNGNYWRGNDEIHRLTKSRHYKLRVDLEHQMGWYWVEYGVFSVGSEATNYLLSVGEFTGNTGDMLSFHNGQMFTTYDRDNDPWHNPNPLYNNSCAILTKGGFWFPGCGYAFVNAVAPYFRWWGLPHGHPYLVSCRMSLLCS